MPEISRIRVCVANSSFRQKVTFLILKCTVEREIFVSEYFRYFLETTFRLK